MSVDCQDVDLAQQMPKILPSQHTGNTVDHCHMLLNASRACINARNLSTSAAYVASLDL